MGKDKKKMLAGINAFWCVLVIGLVVGGLFVGNYLINGGVTPQSGGVIPTDSGTQTTTTTQTTTSPTTTVTTPPDEFTFKASWTWTPAMGTTKPSWLLVELYQDDPLGDYCDGVYMFSSGVWYNAVGTFHFQVGENYRISVGDNVGYDFQLDFADYQVVSPAYVGMQWNLCNSGVYWGKLTFEWVI